jgi:hypothetical protein
VWHFTEDGSEMVDPTFNPELKPAPEEREELKGYMLRFIKYVENDKDLI